VTDRSHELQTPFFPSRMLVRPDDGRVDHDVFEVRVVGHRHEQPVPNAILRPARKANEHTVPVSKNFWKITPRRTRSRQPENGFDKQPVVGSAPPWIADLSRQMRRHPNPLRISQHQANRHSWLPTEKELESGGFCEVPDGRDGTTGGILGTSLKPD